MYNPAAWFWVVGGDESRHYSSAARGYVAPDPDRRVTRIVSEDELWDVLRSQAPQCLPITPESIKADITAAVQERLDSFAQTRGYDDIKSAVTYVGCPVPDFASEAAYCRDQRALTWAALYQIMADVLAGSRPMPTGYADIEAELPVLEWPA